MGQEASIEKAVKKYAAAKGCYVRKFSSPSHRGVPDDIFITPEGVVFFIEFKSPGEEPTDLQAREIREIKKRNGIATWADNTHDGKAIVDDMLKRDCYVI